MKATWLLALLFVPLLSSAHLPERLHLQSQLAKEQHLPFSSAVLVGNTLYIAGTTGVDPGDKSPMTPQHEARKVMDRVKAVVEQSGMTMDDVVSVQVFCTDLADYDAFNGVYKTYFREGYPARAFIGISKLTFGARFEVMGIAIKKGST